jgi:uncharacterized OsmC-like protein
MAEEMVVTFPGNLKVSAQINDMIITTDQPEKSGGDNSGPSPFTLFTASLATCAGYFALKFCRSRKIDTEGMILSMKYAWDNELKKYPQMDLELTLPPEFPDKYKDAIVRAMDQCVVKKHILDPPEIHVRVR